MVTGEDREAPTAEDDSSTWLDETYPFIVDGS